MADAFYILFEDRRNPHAKYTLLLDYTANLTTSNAVFDRLRSTRKNMTQLNVHNNSLINLTYHDPNFGPESGDSL